MFLVMVFLGCGGEARWSDTERGLFVGALVDSGQLGPIGEFRTSQVGACVLGKAEENFSFEEAMRSPYEIQEIIVQCKKDFP